MDNPQGSAEHGEPGRRGKEQRPRQHDGPSRNVPVETMPVAITNAKYPGADP